MHPTIRGDLVLVALVLIVAAVLAARAAWWPTTRCRKCAGEGTRKTGIIRKHTRLCRACRGRGRRIRATRRIANRVILARRDAVRSAERLPR